MNQKPTYEELQKELELTKAKLKAIFNLIPAHVHILDSQLNIRNANVKPPWLQKLGFEKREDIIGKKCYEVLKKRTNTCPECVAQKCLMSGKIETKISTKEEDSLLKFSTKLYAAPIYNSEGKVMGIIELVVDITDINQNKPEPIYNYLERYGLPYRDVLTGLENRQYFFSSLTREISLAERFCLPLSLLMINIDNFKKVNDHFGISCGDDVLYHIGKILQNFGRFCYPASRYSGDGFCLILPNTNEHHALCLADSLRLKINQFDWQRFELTVSIGGASIQPPLTCSIEELIDAADLSLYRAKLKGRNCVVFASSLTDQLPI
ncbi:sensor domain-containing diguanylate cyclase [Spirulina subsalsa FACHB-351]|uniref:Sensor domain-containing diguanylate cyclase n=1 Tax=Spirulina subsalsa FACHB-351 TaxID=234711 RepID=A0ABT3L574_9CYAN|nr:sensor domain-containing diguanylate cyclase [Spirulina subsalsa]MCW6036342.1 sensor domain-containing diguanylate cyclase [Spirulina subsalsa FACHB-351]